MAYKRRSKKRKSSIKKPLTKRQYMALPKAARNRLQRALKRR